MQLILTLPPKAMVILKEISFNCGSPASKKSFSSFKENCRHARQPRTIVGVASPQFSQKY